MLRQHSFRRIPAAPALWAALAFASGIILGRYHYRPALLLTIAIVCFCAFATYFSRKRMWPGRSLALLAFALLGALCYFAHPAPRRANADLLALDGRKVTVTAHVARDAVPRVAATGEASQTVDIAPEVLAPEGNPTIPVPDGALLRLTIHTKAQAEATYNDEDAAPALVLRYGQRISFAGRLRIPRNFRNPGSFDYASYLAERGVVAQMSTSADKLQLLPGSAGTRSGYLRSTIREALVSRIHRLWSPSDAALLDAMVVSERSLVARGARTDFQRSGVYHLLVVAGLHLGIITWFVYASLRRARVHDIFCTLLTLAGAVTYAWLADDGVPIWRATLMLAVYMLARFLYRDREPLNAIGLAALVLLVIDPLALFSPSFQLSFVAVLSIAALALPLLERTSAPYRRGLHQFDAISYDVSLPPRIAQFRLDLRMIAGRLACFLGKRLATWSVVNVTAMIFRAFDLVVISAAMQLCLALPMAWYFHRATTLSVPANVFAVPLAGLLLPATLVALAASTVSLTAARIPAAFAALTLHLILRITNAVSAFHVSDLRVPLPAGPVVLFVVAACVFATLAIRLHRAVAITGIALLLASAVALVIAPSRPRVQTGKLEITAIDVGQGDAFLIVTPDAHTLLIDAGGQVGRAHSDFDFGEDVVAPYLWSRGLRRLDAVALTHSHADHIGGMIGIIGGFHPRELWIGIEPDVEPVQQLLSYAAAHRVEIHQYVQGDHFDFGGVSFRALSPPADWVPRPREANNDSLGFELHYGNSTALMIGDVEKKVEREVATEVGPSGLLKIAHHGSSTSTTPEMLTAARPVYAVISAGHNNSFGHPRADVLARLAAAHVRTARTDMHGAVTFYFDGSPIPTVAGPTNP